MSEYTKAAERLAQFARDWEHFTLAAEALKKVGNLDQVVKESEVKIANLRAEIDQLQALKEVAQDDAEEAKLRSAHILEAASAEADRAIKEAVFEAEETKKRAEEEAKNLLANAEKAVANANAEAANIRTQASTDANAEVQAAMKARAEADKAKAELADFESKITRAREEAQRILG